MASASIDDVPRRPGSGSAPTEVVTVAVKSSEGTEELAPNPEELVFTPGDWHIAQEVTVSAAQDEDAIADAPVSVAHEVRGGGYDEVGEPVVRVTIVEDDVATLAVADQRASEGAGMMRFEVSLSLASDDLVTVEYVTGAREDAALAEADYTAVRGTLQFPAQTTAAQIIEVRLHDDGVDEAYEEFTVTLSGPRPAQTALAGGGDTLRAKGTIEDDDEAPKLSIGSGETSEGDGALRFVVSLDRASTRTVTVRYATADVTAAAAADYTAANGTLTFAAGAGLTRTISARITDDMLDEADEETFTVTLSEAVNGTLALAGRRATGTIRDDDQRGVRVAPTELTLNGGEAGSYTMALTSQPTAAVTVTVTAGAPVAVDPTALTFTAAAWETAQTVSVTAEDDAAAGSTVTITHRVSGGDYAGLAAAPVTVTTGAAAAPETVTTADNARPGLVSLQITGSGNTMYPAFAGDVLHYAMTCDDATTLQVAAQALDSGARLTLLRANEADNQVADGTLNAPLTVDADHDIAIEVSGGGYTATYVVHCLPADFPDTTCSCSRSRATTVPTATARRG